MKCFFNEGLVMFDQDMKVFDKTAEGRNTEITLGLG